MGRAARRNDFNHGHCRLYIVVLLAVVPLVLLRRHEAPLAIAWVLIVIFLPFIGADFADRPVTERLKENGARLLSPFLQRIQSSGWSSPRVPGQSASP